MTTHHETRAESDPPSVMPRQPTADEIRRQFLDTERAKWLTVEETAYVLSTSRDTIFRMIDNRTLPIRKEGKVIRIHVDDLRPLTYARNEEEPCHSK